MNLQDTSNGNDHNPYLIWSNLTATIASGIGSCWLYYDCKKVNPRTVTIKLIQSIALADLFYSIANLLSTLSLLTGDTFCQLEGFIRQLSLIMSIAMTTSIAMFCCKDAEFRFERGENHQEKFLPKAIFTSSVVCTFLAIL